MTYESGPEKRERLLREHVERRQREDPEGWAERQRKWEELLERVEQDRREREERASARRPIGPIGKDPGPSRGYTVPAHGGVVGQDVFAGERRFVHRGMRRII